MRPHPLVMKEKTMPALRLVAVSGGMQQHSKSTVLAQHLLALIAQQLPCQTQLITLGPLATQLSSSMQRSQLPDAAQQALAAVEQADALVVATPVFRGSYTGMFKHFFDWIGQDALVDKPILLAATGGSQRHALMLEHQLRPLFGFFQARTLPLGVYATDSDFVHQHLHAAALLERASLAVQRALPLLALAQQSAQPPALQRPKALVA